VKCVRVLRIFSVVDGLARADPNLERGVEDEGIVVAHPVLVPVREEAGVYEVVIPQIEASGDRVVAVVGGGL
jgi:hypothetical protein